MHESCHTISMNCTLPIGPQLLYINDGCNQKISKGNVEQFPEIVWKDSWRPCVGRFHRGVRIDPG